MPRCEGDYNVDRNETCELGGRGVEREGEGGRK